MESVADVIDRWYAIPGYTGAGLYGGRFGMYTTCSYPFTDRIWSLKLNHLRWVRDIQVTGTGTMQRGRGPAEMALTIRGPGTDKGSLVMTWTTRVPWRRRPSPEPSGDAPSTSRSGAVLLLTHRAVSALVS